VKRYPEIPPLSEASEVVERGHCWITELVDGDHLRFRLRADGRIEFGDRRRTFGGDPPATYGYAVRHVRSSLDRERLRAAVEDVADYVFFGVATRRRRIDYDWERLSPVVGIDVWDAGAGSFRPPDAVEGIFDRLGIAPVNAIVRERNARDFDPEVDTVTESAWYDGPALGVVIRNKAGGRAKRYHPAFEGETGTAVDLDAESAADLAATVVSDERVRRALSETGDPDVAVDRLYDLTVRAAHPLVLGGGIDRGELRSAVAERVHRTAGRS